MSRTFYTISNDTGCVVFDNLVFRHTALSGAIEQSLSGIMQIVTSAVRDFCAWLVSCELCEIPVEQSLGRLVWLQEKVKHPSDALNEKRALFFALAFVVLDLAPTCFELADMRLLTGDAFDGRQMLKSSVLQIYLDFMGALDNMPPKPMDDIPVTQRGLLQHSLFQGCNQVEVCFSVAGTRKFLGTITLLSTTQSAVRQPVCGS